MSPKPKISALILAAARGPNDPMAAAFKAKHKCLIEINGTAMLIRVVQALDAVPEVQSCAVSIDNFDVLRSVSELNARISGENLSLFKSSTSAPQSVVSAIEQMDHPFPLLVTTADHALLTPAMVVSFCHHARKLDCDIAVGVATRSEIERVDTTVKRTYFKFRDGDLSGCNLYYLKSEKALNAVRFWHQVDRIRKKPWALARTFGFGTLIKYLAGILTLEAALKRASVLLDAQTRAVILPYGEAAIDVDKPADHELVSRLLQQREKNLG